MDKHILILFIMGSEVRQFGHSGLIANLLEEGWTVTVAAKIIDSDLLSQLDSRVNVIQLPPMSIPFLLSQVLTVLDNAFDAIQKKKGQVTWVYGRAHKAANIKQKLLILIQQLLTLILQNYAVFRIGTRIENWLLASFDLPQWSQLFYAHKPAIVVVNVSRTIGLPLVLNVAKRAGIKTLLLFHTWKDATVANARINHSFDTIGVWNSAMARRVIEQCKLIKKSNVVEVGCGHFDCIRRDEWEYTAKEFRDQLNLRPSGPLILFMASLPSVVPDEQRYVEILHHAVQSGQLPGDTQIVVRTNPMDETDNWDRYPLSQDGIIHVTRPDWRWTRKQNWCFQRLNDVVTYDNLLRHASVCISVPSTATIECAISGLPVINIGFTSKDMASPMTDNILDFWNAEFYEAVRNTGSAFLTTSEQQFVEHTHRVLNNEIPCASEQAQLIARVLSVEPGSSSHRTFEVIRTTANATEPNGSN